MKQKFVAIFWGLVLILIGAYFLITQTTSFSVDDPRLILGGALVLSALFFASYFIYGRDHWGWLFPAFIFLGLALSMLVEIINPALSDSWIPFLILFSVAVPFIIVYFRAPRTNWWALIPAYVLTVISLIPLLANHAPGELVGAVFMWAVALPFLVVYLTDRTRWWALIPAGVMAVMGLIPLLTLAIDSDLLGGFLMLLFAVPFLVVFFYHRDQNWWALIPAGVFVSIGLTVFATVLFRSGSEITASRMGVGVLFLGFTLTFLALWLLRGRAPTAWAIYPAAALAVLSVAGFIGGQQILQIAFPLALIALGAWMLLRWQRSKA